MLYVSDKISDDLLEVTDSHENEGRLVSVKDAFALGTKVYGLHSNGTVTVYSSVQKFLDMYCMRQALCNNLVSYKLDYSVQTGLIRMRSCSLSDSAVHDLIIPDFVDYICGLIFENKLNLRSVVIPESVSSIDYGCFRGCRNLENVIIEGTSGSELDIGEHAFMCCERLRNVRLREGIRIIPTSCFHGCSSLRELQLPDSLVQINDSAFRSSGLETIRIPDSVKAVRESAFMWCENLRYAYISDAVQVIDSYCFDGCISLEEVHLPKNLRKLYSYALDKTRFKELWLPDTVEFVCSSDFTSPERLLSRLRLSKALLVKQEQYALFNNWYVDTIYLPEGLEELDLNYISNWHFKVIRFPKSVKLKNESVLCSSEINYNLYRKSDFIDRVEVYEGSDAHIKLSALEELKDKLEIIK